MADTSSSPAFRIRQGQSIHLQVFSSVVMTIKGNFPIRYDDGTDDEILVNEFGTAGTYTGEIVPIRHAARQDGYITGGGVSVVAISAVQPARGQVYVRAFISPGPTTDLSLQLLLEGYLYEGFGVPAGMSVEPGPAGGAGFLTIEALANDIAPVDITNTPAQTNAFRVLHGFVVYYNCAAEVANRTVNVSVRAPFGSLPTGMPIGNTVDVWRAPTLGNLTTGQEGTLYARDKLVMDNLATTISVQNNAAAPSPFPLDVDEDDPLTLFFDVGAAHADDRWSIYLLYEEWLVL